MTRDRWVRGGAVLLVGSLLTGCYTYHPVSAGDLRPRERVRVTMTRAHASRLAGALPSPDEVLTGTYLGADENALLLSVPLRSATAGLSSEPLHNRLSVPLSETVQVEGRTLSTWRTATLVGAIAGAVSTGAALVFSGDAEASAEKRGEVDTSRIPVLSIGVPLPP